ncbi:hypothetical protein B5807_04232 [Epicoccum nigrum]|jgi:hypothetical protein|uniref:DNA recombination and repair protein Rad51-like C-terminal domain-containing protein n=1 Tax=Epicoccum nigrum TaxID=105696 RepID=A0A1Y2M4N7_EPING|nr:hypothetical protein B5807_04232 [Epicoccum nigrum]
MASVYDPHHHVSSISARPAEPTLASSLIDSSTLDVSFDGLNRSSLLETSSHSSEVLRTGSGSLDDALGKTFQHGRVVAFSSETSSPRDDLTETLLVDCLTKDPQSEIAIIDTTGNFDVMGLYTRILRRLEKEPNLLPVAEQVENAGREEEKERVAAGILDRVRIMRVFDFVGMREAVGELRDGLEGRSKSNDEVIATVNADQKIDSPLPRKRTEVADSEDEDEELEKSDDEMLFDTETSTADPAPVPEPATSPPTQAKQHHSPIPPIQSRIKAILVDNLAHVLNPVLKKDAVSANTLATTFLTALSDLTHSHSLHTILLNPCTAPRAVSPSRQAVIHSAPQQQGMSVSQQSYTPQPPPPPSIFSSNAAVPALMNLLGRFTDTHVLLMMMPRKKMDARVYYADTEGRERGKRRGVEMVGVIEIVADRWGDRVGAWEAFDTRSFGRLKGV